MVQDNAASERFKPKEVRAFLKEFSADLFPYIAHGYHDGRDDPLGKLTDRLIDNCLNSAFKACGLKVTMENASMGHLVLVAFALSIATFRLPGRGAPKVWDEKNRRKLELELFRQLVVNPDKTMAQHFKAIAKSGVFAEMGKRNKAPTAAALQRQFQIAKKRPTSLYKSESRRNVNRPTK